jgi:hypothetical protein
MESQDIIFVGHQVYSLHTHDMAMIATGNGVVTAVSLKNLFVERVKPFQLDQYLVEFATASEKATAVNQHQNVNCPTNTSQVHNMDISSIVSLFSNISISISVVFPC